MCDRPQLTLLTLADKILAKMSLFSQMGALATVA